MPIHITRDFEWTLADFTLDFNQSYSGNRVNVFTKDLGPEMWKASYVSSHMQKRQAEVLHSRLLGMRGMLESFYCHVAETPLPTLHSPGSYNNVTVEYISNGQVRFRGMTQGNGVREGDYFTIISSQGTQLYMAMNDVDVNAEGVTTLVKTVPRVMFIAQVGDSVVFEKPYAEMVVEPGTLKKNRVDGLVYNVQFSALQVMR